MKSRVRAGISLIEILMAALFLAMAAFPLIRSFSQSHEIATRQVEQETTAKVAEAALNKLMSGRFDDLNAAVVTVAVPFEIQTPSGPASATIDLLGSPAQGTGTFVISGTPYRVQVAVERAFTGHHGALTPAASANALTFSYAVPAGIPGLPPPPPPGLAVATYSCPDDFLRILVKVTAGRSNREMRLITYRGDMRR
ncbi:MAG TPA: hypothetical protein PKM25_09975 [Candidatus Ozemobacteraceae bacterium]|nr:hypothetical protein [Candidatus Ozemobacteraceae bacterium]